MTGIRRTPTPAAVRAFLKRNHLTGAQAARSGYLSGDAAVRKYTTGEKPHRVSGAVWFAWHAHELLPADVIAKIEAAMEEDATPDTPSPETN